MIAAVVALALAAVAASGTAVVLALRAGNDRAVSARVTARLEMALNANGDLTRQLGAEASAHVDTRERLEKVIAQLKGEIARLEGVLDANLEPTAVRDRLAGSGLLSGPPPDDNAAADLATATRLLPARPASGVGTGGGGSGREG